MESMETALRNYIVTGNSLRKVVTKKNILFEVRKVDDGITFPDTISEDVGDQDWVKQSKSGISLSASSLGKFLLIA